MTDSSSKLAAKGGSSSTPKPRQHPHFSHTEHIETLLEHHKAFRINRESIKDALKHIEKAYFNPKFGSSQSGTYEVELDEDVQEDSIRMSLEDHAARLAMHKLKHDVDINRTSGARLRDIYEKLANTVAVVLSAHLFRAVKDDMDLTSVSNNIHSNDVSDLTSVFHLYTFLLSTNLKKKTAERSEVQFYVCDNIAKIMDRYTNLKGVFIKAMDVCGWQNFMHGMIAFFSSLKDSPIISRMQYLMTLYATDEAQCGNILTYYGLGQYAGTAQVKALVDFVRERTTSVSVNYQENAKEMDDALSNSHKSTLHKIDSTLKEDSRVYKRVGDAFADFSAKYKKLSETALMKPFQILSKLTLEERRELHLMRLPMKSFPALKISNETTALCKSFAESLKSILTYYEDLEKLEALYAQYVAESTDQDSEDIEHLRKEIEGVLGNPVTKIAKAVGKTLYSIASTFFGTVKFELNVLLLYQILYASGDASIFGDWANYILGMVACMYMMMSGNTSLHTGDRTLMANLRHNTELALKASKDQIIRTSADFMFEGERSGSLYQIASSPVAAFVGYKYKVSQLILSSQFSMIGRFGVAVALKNGLSISKTLESFASGLSSALFSPASLSDTLRQASATLVKTDKIYRDKSIELFRNLVGHVDSTLGQFLNEALSILKATTGLNSVDTAAFDLRTAADAVIWYYREALKYTGMIYSLTESAVSYVDKYRITRAQEQPVHHYGVFATVLDKIYAMLGEVGVEPKPVVDKLWEGDLKGLLESGWNSFIKYIDPDSKSLPYMEPLRNGMIDALISGLRLGGLVTQRAASDCLIIIPAILLGVCVNTAGVFTGELPIPGMSVLGKTLKRVGRGIAYLSFRDPGTMENAVLLHLRHRIATSTTIVMSQLLTEVIVTTLEKGIGLDNFLGGPEERLLMTLFLQQVFVSSYNYHVARRLNKNEDLAKESPEPSEPKKPSDAAQETEETEEDDDIIMANKAGKSLESIFQ